MIYEGKTKRCLPKYTFAASFDTTFFENHCSNTEKSHSFFNKIVFLQLKDVRKAKGYPDKQMSLIIMDTFKGHKTPMKKLNFVVKKIVPLLLFSII